MNKRCYVCVNGFDVEILKRENGWFYAKYYRRSGERRRLSLDTRNFLTAKEIAQDIVSQDLKGGDSERVRYTDLTFAEFRDKFFLENPTRYRSLVKIRSALNVICRGELGQTKLSDISKNDILRYVGKLSEAGRNPHSLNKAISIIKAVLEYAKSERYISSNPAASVKKFQVFSRERYLKIEELNVLLMCCPEYLRDMIIVSVHLGLRKGELLRLKWGNVDLDNKMVVLEKTKSGLSRYVQLTEKVYELLKARYLAKKRAYQDYVFANKEGNPYVDVGKAFRKVLKVAGIEDMRWHDLRRTYAVYYAQATGDLNSLKANLGHSRLEVTQHYLPISLEQSRTGALKFETYLNKLEENNCHKFDTNGVLNVVGQ